MHNALRAPVATSDIAPHADGSPWSLADAARHLGVSMSTIERRVREGSLASFKFGGRRLIADAELKRVRAGN